MTRKPRIVDYNVFKKYTVVICGYLGGGSYNLDEEYHHFNTKKEANLFIKECEEKYKTWRSQPSLSLIDNVKELKKEIEEIYKILENIA